jgi:hypothetical protein
MSENGVETMTITAKAVPVFAIRKLAAQTQEAGLPLGNSVILLFAIGKTIGLTGDELFQFALPRTGQKPNQLLRLLEDA